MRSLGWLVGLVGLAAACGDSETTAPAEPPPPSGGGDAGGQAPAFPSGTGQAGQAPKSYPAGPYGTGVGSVIRNLTFYGFPDPWDDTTELQLIELADFYNPTGEELHPQGSPYGGGTPKPKALLLNASASWCAPCVDEAKYVFPPTYSSYSQQGGEFLSLLIQNTVYQTAEVSDLVVWADVSNARYPLGLDPTQSVMTLAPTSAFPTNILIDTRTMKIARKANAIDPTFWGKFEQLIDGTYSPCSVYPQSGCPDGEACDLSDTLGNTACRPATPSGTQGESCVDGGSKDPTLCAIGYACSYAGLCQAFCEGASCMGTDTCEPVNADVGVCTALPCTVLPQSGCPPTEACYLTDSFGNTACRPADPSGTQGVSCLNGVNPDQTLCAIGYQCSPTGSCDAYCNGPTCMGADTCELLTVDVGVCTAPPCTVLPQAGCPAGQACDLTDLSGNTACRAASMAGVQGTPCYLGNMPIPEVCAIGYSCSTNQVCEAFCADSSTCGGLTCNTIAPSVGVCE